MDGLRDIYAIDRLARVVVLSNAPNQEEAANVLSAGVLGYCHAYSSSKVLVQVRSVVVNGSVWVGSEMLQYLIAASRQIVSESSENVANRLAKLRPREQQVAKQVSEGLSNKEIARNLKITERTVKAHISATFITLEVKDRLQLALILNDKYNK
jgi:DNA-binding NarL/FixJ family response regulator